VGWSRGGKSEKKTTASRGARTNGGWLKVRDSKEEEKEREKRMEKPLWGIRPLSRESQTNPSKKKKIKGSKHLP